MENANMRFKHIASRPLVSTVLIAALLSIASAAAAQTENILHRFNPTTADGLNPQSGLVADKSGNLYGTTYQGGSADWGTVYQLKPPATAGGAWTETILHDFTNNADGATPLGNLAFDKSGNLFGTTIYGGIGINGNSNGTVFELSPASGGTWTYKVIASFDDGAVAINPVGSLVFDASGNLYGASGGGIEIALLCGDSPCGNVFELQPPTTSGGAWTGKSIYNFGTSGANDGLGPSYVVFGPGGALYGTTSFGGTLETGTFYKLTPPATSGGAWTEKILFSFPNNTGIPYGGLTAGGNGTFFGTAAFTGTSGSGIVFQLIPPSGGKGWTQSVLYNFTGGSDGNSPVSGVLRDSSGNLYGVANGGANFDSGMCLANGCGTVYKLSPPAVSGGAWTETTLHDFAGGHDGGNPVGRPILLKDFLFGTTAYAGTPNFGLGGTVYRIMP
jgi:uncharacterized repeat protein (TIGR03803 family)